jgi:hypothetical protein
LLWKTLLIAVKNQLPTKSVELLDNTNRAVNFKVKVNSFFGWAIAEVHKSLVEELANDFKDNNSNIQKRLDFVSQIQCLDHEAALDPSYPRESYNGIY